MSKYSDVEKETLLYYLRKEIKDIYMTDSSDTESNDSVRVSKFKENLLYVFDVSRDIPPINKSSEDFTGKSIDNLKETYIVIDYYTIIEDGIEYGVCVLNKMITRDFKIEDIYRLYIDMKVRISGNYSWTALEFTDTYSVIRRFDFDITTQNDENKDKYNYVIQELNRAINKQKSYPIVYKDELGNDVISNKLIYIEAPLMYSSYVENKGNMFSSSYLLIKTYKKKETNKKGR